MHGQRSAGASRLLAVALVTSGALTAPAHATQNARISAAFRPERLGAQTAVSLGFRIYASGGGLPAPLTGVDLHYPANLGLATSGLGVATCDQATLEYSGPGGCPANSRMGSGSALVRFQIGPETFAETATLGLVAGPSQGGYVRLLVSATGESPVAARIVMSTLLTPGHLQLNVPLVPSVPGGPDVSVVRVQATLGGNLTYYEHVHGRTVAYRPRGISLPRRCPRGGFRFDARFSFIDGTRAFARTAVSCPARHGRR